jgi:hypothetical protein
MVSALPMTPGRGEKSELPVSDLILSVCVEIVETSDSKNWRYRRQMNDYKKVSWRHE